MASVLHFSSFFWGHCLAGLWQQLLIRKWLTSVDHNPIHVPVCAADPKKSLCWDLFSNQEQSWNYSYVSTVCKPDLPAEIHLQNTGCLNSRHGGVWIWLRMKELGEMIQAQCFAVLHEVYLCKFSCEIPCVIHLEMAAADLSMGTNLPPHQRSSLKSSTVH